MQILSRINNLRSVGVGFVAQGMTLVSGILPAFFGLDDVLVFILVVVAFSTITAGVSTLAIGYRLPTAHLGERRSQSLVRSALLCTGSLGLTALVAGGVVYTAGEHSTGALIACVAIVLVAQASYLIAQAVLVAADCYPEFMAMRFTYACILLAGNVVLCLAAGNKLSFIACIAVAYGLSAAIALLRTKIRRLTFSRIPYGLRSIGHDIRSGSALITGQFFNGVSMQAGALAAGTMGSFAPAWALATRVTNGFQTIAGQILTPAIDTTVARGIREQSRMTVRSGTRNGLLFGSALGLGCLVASVVAVLITGILPDSATSGDLWSFFAATAVYNCLNIVIIPIDRILPFLGRTRFRMMWDIFRAATMVPSIIFLHGDAMLVALTVISGIAFTIYVGETWSMVWRYRSHKIPRSPLRIPGMGNRRRDGRRTTKAKTVEQMAAEAITIELDMSVATLFHSRRQYGDIEMSSGTTTELRALREQNAELRRRLAEAELRADGAGYNSGALIRRVR